MLEYLSGIGRAKKPPMTKERKKSILKKALLIYPPAIALRLAKQAIAKNKNMPQADKQNILKKAFALYPPAVAIRLAKQAIEKNKNKPNSATQNTQHRALKSVVMAKRKAVFKSKGDPILLDEETINQTPVKEQQIEDKLIDQEVDNEIDQEERFEEDNAEMGIYFNESLSGKAQRKAKKEAKTDKIKAKADSKRMKGEAKLNRSQRPRASFKDISTGILDTVKQGAGIYKDIKGGKGSEETEPTEKPSGTGMNKMLLYGGIGLAVVLGGYMLMKKKK